MTDLLEIDDLNAFYGHVQALHGLAIKLRERNVTALLGANGAGKSTTLRAICNMVRFSGTIRFDGRPLAGKTTAHIAKMGIAHVPEGRGTFARLTVAENLQLGAITRSGTREIAADVDRMCAYFPKLKERYNQRAGTLSGGEQQMLAVARALMARPRLMLLDEPSFGLAPLVVRDLFELLGRVNREENVSILLVEQNAELALEIAQQAYVIETGRIVMSGEASDIAKDEAIRKAYLGY